MPVRNRGLPRCGEGNGLDAHRLAGALPGVVFLVAPAEDRTNPGPPEPIAPDEERRTGQPTPLPRTTPAAVKFILAPNRCHGGPDHRACGEACAASTFALGRHAPYVMERSSPGRCCPCPSPSSRR